MNIRIKRGTLLVVFIALALTAVWSFRLYRKSAEIHHQGLAQIEKERAARITQQIAEVRQGRADGDVHHIQGQMNRLLDLARQSKMISLEAGYRALGSLWTSVGLGVLALLTLCLLVQRHPVETEGPLLKIVDSPSTAIEDIHDAALRLADELYTLAAELDDSSRERLSDILSGVAATLKKTRKAM